MKSGQAVAQTKRRKFTTPYIKTAAWVCAETHPQPGPSVVSLSMKLYPHFSELGKDSGMSLFSNLLPNLIPKHHSMLCIIYVNYFNTFE